LEKVLEHLNSWKEFVSAPRKELNDFPICPFAKNAEILFDIIESEEMLLIQVLKRERSSKQLFMFVDINNVLTYTRANYLIDFYNSISRDYQYFVDDVNNPQFMNSVNTSNSKYLIIIGQRNDILNLSREKLMKTGYYKFLEKKYLKKIGVDVEKIND
jgi:hypothetical protein